MIVGSLFSGVGGLELGLPPHDLAWMCEADKHCRRVLATQFPGVPLLPDVREVDNGVASIDMLIGGYP